MELATDVQSQQRMVEEVGELPGLGEKEKCEMMRSERLRRMVAAAGGSVLSPVSVFLSA